MDVIPQQIFEPHEIALPYLVIISIEAPSGWVAVSVSVMVRVRVTPTVRSVVMGKVLISVILLYTGRVGVRVEVQVRVRVRVWVP